MIDSFVRELLTLNHPVHAYFYVVGALTSAYVLAWAIWFALVSAIHITRLLVTAWLDDEPKQLQLPSKGP